MVFSFFRKKDDSVAQVRQPVAPLTPSAKPAAPARPSAFEGRSGHAASSIEVSGGDSGLSPAAEEAAILYANGRSDAAIDTLRNGIAETDRFHHNLDAWFMLFDLFQVEGRKEDFEKLVIDFVVQFERSAPSWIEDGAETSALPEALRTGGGKYFSLTGKLTAASRNQIEEMQQASEKDGAFRVDFCKLEAVEAEGCKLLLDALQRFRRQKKELVLSGAAELETLLQATTQENFGATTQCCWLLLLELYQLQGRQEEFENLSVDYAVAYEVSPPSWEAQAQMVIEETRPELEMASAGEIPPDAFRFSGVITGSAVPQIPELTTYAEKRKEVVIDMRRLKRADFVSAGVLLNAFAGLKRAGKRIIILGANEMIIALFTVVGINQFTILLKNKQH